MILDDEVQSGGLNGYSVERHDHPDDCTDSTYCFFVHFAVTSNTDKSS